MTQFNPVEAQQNIKWYGSQVSAIATKTLASDLESAVEYIAGLEKEIEQRNHADIDASESGDNPWDREQNIRVAEQDRVLGIMLNTPRVAGMTEWLRDVSTAVLGPESFAARLSRQSIEIFQAENRALLTPAPTEPEKEN